MHVHMLEADFGKIRIWRPKEVLYGYGVQVQRAQTWERGLPSVRAEIFIIYFAFRYSYDHLPLGEKQRNYAEILITLEPELSVISQLKPVSTDMYKVTEWLSDESDSDQE
jgi:hypothetical protein